MKFIKLFATFLLMSGLAGCSGEGGGVPSQDNKQPDPIQKQVVSLQITPATLQLAKKTSHQYLAIATFDDDSTEDVTTTVSWHSSNDTAATINKQGIAHAIELGDTEITATLNGITSNTATLSVTDAAVRLIQVVAKPERAAIAVGMVQQYYAHATFSDGSTQDIGLDVSWHSSKPAVATLSVTGEAAGLSVGKTMITGTFDGVTSSEVQLLVSAAMLTRIEISPATTTIAKGLTQHYQATGTLSDGTVLDVTQYVNWHSSHNDVASIESIKHVADGVWYGKATGLDIGQVTITATFDDVTSNSATLTVTPATLVDIAITPLEATITKQATQQYQAIGTLSDGTTIDVTTEAAWHADNQAIATMSMSGEATGVSVGQATIHATLQGIHSNNATLTIALPPGYRVVTWGAAYAGGDSSAVQPQLTNVTRIFGNLYAYAALKNDGTVVTWGAEWAGANSSGVQARLTDVVEIFGNQGNAFAALKSDGTLVVWGAGGPGYAGDASAVQAQLTNVRTVVGNQGAFAALKNDGTVVTWGESEFGGDSSAVQSQLTDVREIIPNDGVFAALKNDGTVVTWGEGIGGDSSVVQSQLIDVTQIICSKRFGFSALKRDGTVVMWGSSYDSSAVQSQLVDIVQIFSNPYAFAGLKRDGSVVTWGPEYQGGDSSAVQSQLVNVKHIFSNEDSFAALKNDGTVVTWGNTFSGGDSSAVQSQLTGVKTIYSNGSNGFAFAALKDDGTVVTWGSGGGGDSSEVQSELIGVAKIFSNLDGFAALKHDGSLVSWGNSISHQTGVVNVSHTYFSFAALVEP